MPLTGSEVISYFTKYPLPVFNAGPTDAGRRSLLEYKTALCFIEPKYHRVGRENSLCGYIEALNIISFVDYNGFFKERSQDLFAQLLQSSSHTQHTEHCRINKPSGNDRTSWQTNVMTGGFLLHKLSSHTYFTGI